MKDHDDTRLPNPYLKGVVIVIVVALSVIALHLVVSSDEGWSRLLRWFFLAEDQPTGW